MPDFLSLCRSRRSVRAFRADLPADADLDYIRQCVAAAPSACNRQPYHFRYICDKDHLAKLTTAYNREWFATAPACFIVYRDTQTEWVRRSDGKPHGDIDAAIAIEHLCLAAAERGLGTCWVCAYDPTVLEAALPSPEGRTPVALIPIGFPADSPSDNRPRKPIDEIFC